MLGVGCALGPRLVLASISFEVSLRRRRRAPNSKPAAAESSEGAVSAATHQLERDLQVLTQFVLEGMIAPFTR